MNTLKSIKHNLTMHSIGRRFAIQILLFSSVVTLFSTAMQLTLEYQRDVSEIEAQLNQIRDSNSLSLASSLWVTSQKDLQLQIDGLLRLPDMQYIEVKSEKNEILAMAGTPKTSQIINYEYPLYYTHRNMQIYLGSLHITASLTGVFHRLQEKVMVIMITQGIKTFLVSFFILYLFQQLIGKYLRKISEFLTETRDNSMQVKLDLQRTQNNKTNGDELDLMVNSVNEMRTRLAEYYKELQESEFRWKFALEGSGDGVYDWDLTTNKVNYSDHYKEMLGYSKNENWQDISVWEKLCHPEDKDKVLASVQAYFDGITPQFESQYRAQHKNGNWIWILSRGMIVARDKNGNPLRIIGTNHDITQQKDAEAREKLLNQQLLQATKMESIGHLTGGIAHDFNNILGAIMGYAQITRSVIARKQEEYPAIQRYIVEILHASERAKELISQMLIFSRLSPDKADSSKQVIMLAPIVKEVVNLLRSSIPAQIELTFKPPPENIYLAIQPVRLHQVLLNLGINARDAVGEYGKINISVSTYPPGEALCSACKQDFSGDFIDISIQDNGSGIPDNIIASVFDPFFTTKPVGKGTGMGLSVVHGIVHDAGGHIVVDTEMGKGTTFHILLPRATAPAITSNDQERFQPLPEKVLSNLNLMVVDDEKAMTAMLKDLLELNGANVAIFNSPFEALEKLTAAISHFDLIITDESMPELSGMDFSKMVLNIRPDMPIILCTGYSENATPEAVAAIGIAGFMYKPLDTRDLIGKIIELQKKFKN